MTSLPTIPDEYREKAARLVYGLECYGISFESITEDAREEDIMSIARALVEEREACIKILEEGTWNNTGYGRYVSASAKAIILHPTHSAAAPLEAR